MKNNLNFLKIKKTKNSLASPIDCKLVNEVVCENQLLPLGLSNKLKFYIKIFLKIGFFLPSLYYDKRNHFFFFPRPSKLVLDKLYSTSNNLLSSNIKSRNQSFNSNSLYLCAKMIINFAGLKNAKATYVDFGAGTGWLAKALSIHAPAGNIIAVDYSWSAISHLKKNKNIKILTSKDFFNDEKIHVSSIYFLGSVDTLEHMDDPLDFLRKVHKRINKGAKVFLSVPNFDSYFSRIKLGCHPYFGYPAHLNYFTAKSLKLICKNAGFTVVKQATTMFQYEAAYVSNCFPKNLIKLNSWQINDILNDGRNGERLFILVKK